MTGHPQTPPSPGALNPPPPPPAQGLSTELGAFVAGVMLSTTDQQENALHHLEQIKAFFISLFIASTGLVMSPVFLAQHLPILTAGVILVVLAKTVVVRPRPCCPPLPPGFFGWAPAGVILPRPCA